MVGIGETGGTIQGPCAPGRMRQLPAGTNTQQTEGQAPCRGKQKGEESFDRVRQEGRDLGKRPHLDLGGRRDWEKSSGPGAPGSLPLLPLTCSPPFRAFALTHVKHQCHSDFLSFPLNRSPPSSWRHGAVCKPCVCMNVGTHVHQHSVTAEWGRGDPASLGGDTHLGAAREGAFEAQFPGLSPSPAPLFIYQPSEARVTQTEDGEWDSMQRYIRLRQSKD